MIERIELRNFQSHTESIFEFTDGVNAIIGPSDSGKTALLRALRWVVWNRPLGDAFRSDWGGDTSVVLRIPGHTIERWKNDNGHGYTIDGNKLKAIKTDVPEEVVTALNLNEINLQQQFDRPFLLDASSGEVAQHFNKVAQLDSIDSTMKTLTAWHRKLNQYVGICESKITEYETALQGYGFVEEMEQQLQIAATLQDQITCLTKESAALETVMDALQEMELQMEEYAPLMEIEKDVDEYLVLREQRTSLQTAGNALSSIIYDIRASMTVLQQLDAIPAKETCIDAALELCQRIRTLKKEYEELSRHISSLNGIEQEVYNIMTDNEASEKTYNDLFPNTCPLCGSTKGRGNK